MRHDDAVFDYWRTRPALKVWEIAYLMHRLEPRQRANIMVQDPEDPSSIYGMELDIAEEVRALADAVRVGDLDDVSDGVGKDEAMLIPAIKLLPWLLANGHGDLAESLRGYASPDGAATAEKARRPPAAQIRQEEAIVGEIRRQGFDPMFLPERQRGKGGVKANVWTAIAGHPEFGGRRPVYDKAWDRLRAKKELVGGN